MLSEPQIKTEQTNKKLDLPPGVPPLTSLYLYIAGTCNLACRHCWITPTFQPDGKSDKFIKLEYVEKVIAEAKPLGLRSVKLTGGEPTLHPQFRQLVTMIAEAGLDIIVESNGLLIDANLAKFMRNKRVCFISISLDGANAETHEALRLVEGSFQRAIDGIGALVSAGFRPQMICTLHRGNVSQIEDIVKLAESLGCGSIKFNHIQDIGRGGRFFKEQGLGVSEIINLYRYIEHEVQPKSKIYIHYDIPYAFYSIRTLMKESIKRCTVHNILGMLSSGELSLCGIGVTVPEMVFGHIALDSLHQVWCEASSLLELRAKVPGQFEGICGRCIHKNICMGECIANNYNQTNKINASYIFCVMAEELGLFPSSRRVF